MGSPSHDDPGARRLLTPYQAGLAASSIADLRRKLFDTSTIDRKAIEEAIVDVRKICHHSSHPLFVYVRSPREYEEKLGITGLQQFYGRRNAVLSDDKVGSRLTAEVTNAYDPPSSALARHVRSPLEQLRLMLQEARSAELGQNILFPSGSRHHDMIAVGSAIVRASIARRSNREEDHLEERPSVFGLLTPEKGQFDLPDMWPKAFALDNLRRAGDIIRAKSPVFEPAWRAATGCAFWWSFERAVFVCDRPSAISVDEFGRLHSTRGPAVEWRDGTRSYAVRGVEVEARYFEMMGRLAPADIHQIGNLEVRRIMIEVYGYERYLRESGAVVIHESGDGLCKRRLWWAPTAHDSQHNAPEPLVMVELINSTPEPDGTHKRYFLRVAPHIRDADEAVASTWMMSTRRYKPVVET